MAPQQDVDFARLAQAARGGKSRHVEFNVGDGVLRRTGPLSSAACGFAASLDPKWRGSYQVTTQVPRLTYEITQLSINEQSGRAYVADSKCYFLLDQKEDGERPALATSCAWPRARTRRGGQLVYEDVDNR